MQKAVCPQRQQAEGGREKGGQRSETCLVQSPWGGPSSQPFSIPTSGGSRLSLTGYNGSVGSQTGLFLRSANFSTRDADNDNCLCKCSELMSGGEGTRTHLACSATPPQPASPGWHLLLSLAPPAFLRNQAGRHSAGSDSTPGLRTPLPRGRQERTREARGSSPPALARAGLLGRGRSQRAGTG